MQRAPCQARGRGQAETANTDPDLVTQLSKEEPADSSVMTAAQGSSAPALWCRDNGSFVGKGRCGGCRVSVLQDLRRGMLSGEG